MLLLKIETARIDSLLGGILVHADKLMVTRNENLNISTGRKILYGMMVTRIENLNISRGRKILYGVMVTRIENLNISTGRKILYGVMMTRIENLNISTGQENTLVENQFTATSTEDG